MSECSRVDPDWNLSCDVAVVGSGAAGLAAAIAASDTGAEVVVLEKTDMVGGTTGVSGGMPWIPLNRHMPEVGVRDSREDAISYLRRLTLGREPDPDLLEVYVDRAPEVLAYLEDHTPLRMSAPPGFSDYYADLPGGRPAGRSIEPLPFDATCLGDWAPRLRTSPFMPWLTMEEGAKFLTGVEPPDFAVAGRRQASDVRVLGAAMVAALFRGLLDRRVEVLTGASARELLLDDDGAATGLLVERDGVAVRVSARRGVVLACGGFEWDRAMVRAFIGQELHPMSPAGNEGDGHRMAMRAGAELGNMSSFWGQPAILEPGFEYEGRPVPQMGSFRSTPGVILVNKHGRRFTNEAVAYNDLPKTFGSYDPVAVDYPNTAPAWMIFDQRVKDSSVVLPSILPGAEAPAWVARAGSIGDLAELLGIEPSSLEATVSRWNDQVARGEDTDFHRGTVWFEAFMSGGPSVTRCLAPVERAPFYAIELQLGTLGTNGGPLIDASGGVRRYGGGVVGGLYAAGNAAASIFGPAYPGGGATIGPALVFGFLAGGAAGSRAVGDRRESSTSV